MPINLAVITPFYNAARFLRDCLESVADDPQVDLHLLVDDASTDEGYEVIKQFAEKTPRQNYGIQVVRIGFQHHQYVAMNAGIEAALQLKAKYLAFLDADDVAMPRRFSLQVSKLEANPNWMAVGGGLSDIDVVGNSIPGGRVQTTPGNVNLDQWKLELPQGSCPFFPATATFRNQVFQSLGGFMPVPTLGDLEFVNRLAWWSLLTQNVVHNTDVPAIFRRVHPQQVSQQQDATRAHFRASYLEWIKATHKLYRMLAGKKLLVPEQLYYGRWAAPVSSANSLLWRLNPIA